MNPKGRPAGANIRRSAAPSALALLVGLASLAFSFAGRAEAADEATARRTILLVAAPEDPTAARIAAELRTLGFDVEAAVERRTTFPPLSLSEIELLSRGADAAATIGVDLGTGDVRVWTTGHAPGRIVLRAVVPLDADPAIAALRAVEALRTLVNRGEATAPEPSAPATVLPPTPPAESDAGRQVTTSTRGPPSVGFEMGPALAASPGPFGPSGQGWLALHWLLRPRWGVEILGIVPVTGGRWRETEGSASLALGLAATGLHWRPLTLSWCLLDLGAGLGAALLHTESAPSRGYVGEKNDTFVASPFVRVGYAVPLSRLLSLRADLAAVVVLPRPVFTVAERTLRSWGWPLAIGSLGIEVALH